MRIRLATLVLFAASLPMMCLSAAAASLEPGTLELWPAFSVQYSSEAGSSTTITITTTNLSLSTRLGFCLTRWLEVQGGPVLAHSTYHFENFPFYGINQSGSSTVAGAVGGMTANFRTTGPLVPFIRAEAGVLSYSGDLFIGSKASVEAPILAAGMRWMVGSSAAVSIELDYDHVTHPDGYTDTPRNDIEFAVGMSVLTRYRK